MARYARGFCRNDDVITQFNAVGRSALMHKFLQEKLAVACNGAYIAVSNCHKAYFFVWFLARSGDKRQ